MPPLESTPLILLLWGLFGYLMGSVPYGMVLTRLMGLGNLREIGSGNIGATNVLRTGNKLAAALTVILDGAKGAVAVLAARALASEDAVQLAALAAMVGHCYPVWLKFAGGKAVATFLGIMLAIAWPVGIACCLAWLVAAALTRTSSMGGLAAASSSSFFLVGMGYGYALFLTALLTLLVFWRHRANIKRIRQGIEPRIGQK
ncbi:MAG: glycerol-3-phosphate 1-O-acyltransferase PlsY [Pseudomonadota bacterium]